MARDLTLGASYLWRGLRMLNQPGIRGFVLIPLGVNILIFSSLTIISVNQFNLWIDYLLGWLPDWPVLDLIRWIILPLLVALLLVVFMYSFSIVANFIAAPFNGLLAEKVEERLTGAPVNASETFADALRLAPRAIAREASKILYYLPRAILLGLLSLPLLFLFPPAVTVIWFVFGAWMMCMQYVDFPMDNHRHNLKTVRNRLASRRLTSLGFGGFTLMATMIPLVNFLAMPAAVCGATIFWVEALQEQSRPGKGNIQGAAD